MNPRDLRNLDELAQLSAVHGPLDLETFGRVVGSHASSTASLERLLRLLQARARKQGLEIHVTGMGESLRADFTDERLRLELVRALTDQASNGSVHSAREVPSEAAPLTQIVSERGLGLDIRRLCRRHGIGEHRMTLLLIAAGCEPRPARALRVEERRSLAVLERALAQPRGWGFVARVARVLGCHRNTARVFLRRVERSQRRGRGAGLGPSGRV